MQGLASSHAHLNRMLSERRNAYSKPCVTCGDAQSCAPCVATASCERCTPSARCGTCRRVFSVQRREEGKSASSADLVRGRGDAQTPRRRRVALAPASAATDTALDFPREQDGLHAYYELVARQTSALRRSGSRWIFDFKSGDLHVEHVRPRDCYETPSWIWRFYVAREALTLDAHSSTMNAITPSYLTLASGQGASEIPYGTHIWLNPAYGGGRDCGIGPALEELVGVAVRQRDCTLVALLPNLSYMLWFHRYVMSAHEVHYLRHKVTFSNPFMAGRLNESFSPQIVAIWRPGVPPVAPPFWVASDAVQPVGSPSREFLRVRRCCRCGKWRLLPRHQVELGGTAAPAAPFECARLCDASRNSCEAPQPVCSWG